MSYHQGASTTGMLPRPQSVLNDPALWARRPAPSPTGMLPTKEEKSGDPMLTYGWEYSEADDTAVERAIDTPEKPTYPLIQSEEKDEWVHVTHMARYTFKDRLSRLNKEAAYLDMAIALMENEFQAAKLLEEKRDGIGWRLSFRLMQVNQEKLALTRQSEFNKDYYKDLVAIHHVLREDSIATRDQKWKAYEKELEGMGLGGSSGFRSLSG